MKSLEALKEIKKYNKVVANSEELNIIEKDLKTLEIIKKRKLLNYVLKNKKCADMYHLTDEELTLLEEAVRL